MVGWKNMMFHQLFVATLPRFDRRLDKQKAYSRKRGVGID